MSYYTSNYTGSEIDALLASVDYATLTEKLQPHDNDMILLSDSQDEGAPKKAKIANLPIGGSNKNLLHNWDFRNPVNQRGQLSYTDVHSNKYTFDRWYGYTEWGSVPANITWEEGVGAIITSQPIPGYPAAYGCLNQKIEYGELNSGQILTLSALVLSTTPTDDGRYPRLYLNSDYIEINTTGLIKLTTALGNITDLFGRVAVFAGSTTSSAVKIERMKLELGEVSTLPSDPPEDSNAVLQTCKRFFRLWTTAEARAEALKEIGLMRLASPTLGTIDIGGVTYYYASADL